MKDINDCILKGIPVRRNQRRVIVKGYVNGKLKDIQIQVCDSYTKPDPKIFDINLIEV